MDQRTLGRDGPKVSALGFGAMALSGGYEPVDETDARNTIARALELGVTLFDTADFYTKGSRTASAEWGHNETFVGECLKGRRDEVVLSTKGGYTFDAAGAIAVNGRPDYLRQACEGSLRRLGVETIDVYYLHRVDPNVPVDDSVGAMADLVHEGKVRWLGLSEASPADIRSACAVHPITALQYEYSLLNRDPETEVLPLCRELGIGFVPFSPLSRGLLSGAIKSVDDMDETDWRRNSAPRFSREHLAKNLELVARLAAIAEDLDATVAQVAIAWILHQGQDITPMIGATHPDFVAANTPGAALRLSPDILAEIAAIFPPGAAAGARFPESFQKAVRR